MDIRPIQPDDFDAVKDFVEHAFEPIFESFEQILGEQVFPLVYPDWRGLHRGFIDTFYNDENMTSLIAVIDDQPAGYIVYHMTPKEKTGVIEFLAVNPNFQNRGIGTQLNDHVIDTMREAGIKVVSVGTGGDPSHAPARHTYEKSGFKPLPSVWYFRHID